MAKKLFSLLRFLSKNTPFTSVCRTSWPRFHAPVPSVAPCILKVRAASSLTTYTLLQEVCQSAGWAALGEKTFLGLRADPAPAWKLREIPVRVSREIMAQTHSRVGPSGDTGGETTLLASSLSAL